VSKEYHLKGLRSEHVYTILKVDGNGNYVLRDPAGEGAPSVPADREVDGMGPGVFWISRSELERNFMGIAIED
jgi:hypothetical protein